MFKKFKIQKNQIGLLFRDGAFDRILEAGTHRFFDPFNKLNIVLGSVRSPVFTHEQLDEIVKTGTLKRHAQVVDLSDHERALIWIDGRFSQILAPGLYAIWNSVRDVRVEVIDASQVQLAHSQLAVISRTASASKTLDVCEIERDRAGVLFIDGKFVKVLSAGRYAFWLGMAKSIVREVDLREQAIDVSGQDLITSDKVTLRLNALATFRIVDPRRAVSVNENAEQTLYRCVQLALRTIVGTRTLDEFLADKHAVAGEALDSIKPRAGEIGLELVDLGIRDIILPGDMKELMNKVTEARKAAEANLIFRREETAAMRSQANTAKLLEANPTLMRLRELEVLEKVAESSNLQVVLGDGGLGDRLTKLI